GEQRGVELIEQPAVLAGLLGALDRTHELGARVVAPADAHVRLVAGEAVGFLARLEVALVVARQRPPHLLDEPAGRVRERRRLVIADALERLARHRVILARGEHLGRLANLLTIALGRDALGTDALPQRAAERLGRLLLQLRIVAGPAQRVA